MKVETNVKAGAECVLASPAQAMALCKAGKIGTWDIAAIQGKAGLCQYGPGYKCKQGMEGSGIGNAVCK